jgi:hypothetical protein
MTDDGNLSYTPVCNVVTAQRDRHVFGLTKHFVAPSAAFAAGAAGFGATKGLAQVAHVLAVHKAHAGFDGGGHAVRFAQVLSRDVAAQTVVDVIGFFNGVGFVFERDQAGIS